MSNGVADVPTLAQAGDQKLPPGALGYLNTRAVLDLSAWMTAIGLVLWWLLDGPVLTIVLVAMVAVLVVGLLVDVFFLNPLRLRWTSYSVEPDFIYITRGALLRSSVLIPTRQILKVETRQGPLLRRTGMVMVRFRCITAVESFGPLEPDAVVQIRQVIAFAGDGHDQPRQ